MHQWSSACLEVLPRSRLAKHAAEKRSTGAKKEEDLDFCPEAVNSAW